MAQLFSPPSHQLSQGTFRAASLCVRREGALTKTAAAFDLLLWSSFVMLWARFWFRDAALRCFPLVPR